MQLLQQAPAADSAAAAAGPAGNAAVLPVQLRQFMAVGASGMPAAAAAVVDNKAQLKQQQGELAGSSSRTIGSSSNSSKDNDALQQAQGVVVVSRFASYGAAAGDLQPPLLQVVRQLLYGQAGSTKDASEDGKGA
jgi:hypothetical protein